MPHRTLVFDFDGTLADSLAASVRVLGELSPRFRLKPIDLEQARHTPTKALLKQMGLPFWRLPRLIRAFQAEMVTHAAGLKLWPGLPEVLTELAADGRALGVLSSNREDIIRACLRANGVEECFRFVVGTSSLFGKGRALRRLVRDERLDAAEVVYIGDELRDMQAARRAGVKSAAVTWGFQAEELLRTGGPEYVVTTPAGLRGL